MTATFKNKKNIVLIGLMGCGKTTIGCLLNEQLKTYNYTDLDDEIEKYAEKKISEIFEEFGEKHFRNIENNVVSKFSSKYNQIISTGGGVVENLENIELLRKNGVLFYLKASAETLYHRVKNTSHRPLLKTKNPLTTLQELLAKREERYQLADFVINTEQKNLTDVVLEILEQYETVI